MRTRSMATTPVTVVPTVPEHLTCCICFEAFEDPVFHGCGRNHGFCRECCCSLAVAEAETVMDTAGPSGAPAVQLSSVSGGTSLLGTEPPPASITIACPLCRTRSPFSSLVPADELVTQLELHATDCEACGERVSLGALKRHRRRCSANANAVAMETETTDTQWRRRVRALRGNQTLSGSAVQETAADAAATQTNNVTYRNRSTFTCPLCVEDGTVVTGNEDHPGCHLDAAGLVRHLEAHNSNGGRRPGVCPICVAMPWGNPEYVSNDLAAHVRLRHRYDVTLFSDLSVGEEQGMQLALERSARDGADTESVMGTDSEVDTDSEEEDADDDDEGVRDAGNAELRAENAEQHAVDAERHAADATRCDAIVQRLAGSSDELVSDAAAAADEFLFLRGLEFRATAGETGVPRDSDEEETADDEGNIPMAILPTESRELHTATKCLAAARDSDGE